MRIVELPHRQLPRVGPRVGRARFIEGEISP